ncbi:hypothetical protein D3C85_1740250 [compost metagenome]
MAQVLESELDLRIAVAELGHGQRNDHLADAGAGHQIQYALLVFAEFTREFVDALDARIDLLDFME